jgi:hypothetical protein
MMGGVVSLEKVGIEPEYEPIRENGYPPSKSGPIKPLLTIGDARIPRVIDLYLAVIRGSGT